jgi:nucleoside 2-deoxyribosyltransferase
MKAYISASFSKRSVLENEIAVIKKTLIENGISPFVFVDEYLFETSQEQEMMQLALKEIDDCDLFIAETSIKGIGIGVEAGYAKAKNKTIFYLRNSASSHSTTISGISDFRIIYQNAQDLYQHLTSHLKTFLKEMATQ